MKSFLVVMAVIFLVLAIVFYANSTVSIGDGEFSMAIANIQLTVFAAACAVMFVINTVGAILADQMETIIEKLNDKSNAFENITSLKRIDNNRTDKPNASYSSSSESQSNDKLSSNKRSIDPAWIDIGDYRVKCPECMLEMTIDYIQARKKCPQCGYQYKE